MLYSATQEEQILRKKIELQLASAVYFLVEKETEEEQIAEILDISISEVKTNSKKEKINMDGNLSD